MLISSNPTIVSPTSGQVTITLSIQGMKCASCVQSVEQQLLQQGGVISAAVDLTTEKATVECEASVKPILLANALTEAGFPSQPLHSENNASTSRRWTLIGFYIIAVVFNLCLIAQVLTVGLAYFNEPEWWNVHVLLVRGYSGLSLILLVWVYLVPFPRRVRSLAFSMPVLLGLQFLTIHLKTSIPLGVLHPLIGFTLFSASTTLVHRVWRVISPKSMADGED